jgi:hypothetical protein
VDETRAVYNFYPLTFSERYLSLKRLLETTNAAVANLIHLQTLAFEVKE